MSKLYCSDYEWNIFNLCYQPKTKYAIIILNTGLQSNKDNKHIRELWKTASVRVCVDGGTNEFHKYIYEQQSEISVQYNLSNNNKKNEAKEENILSCDIPIPHIISGDFDSVDCEILELYRNAGTCIIPTPDQNETDFTKALVVLGDYIAEHELQINHVIAIAGINSSRFDHVLANVNTLYKIKSSLTYPLIIISGSSLIWLLDPGTHQIHIPSTLLKDKERSWCGYASLSGQVTVSTLGLKWDVDNKTVLFGQMISTCNTYKPESTGIVHVTCSGMLLWFMGWDQMGY